MPKTQQKKNVGKPFTITVQEMSSMLFIMGFAIYFIALRSYGFPTEATFLWFISMFFMAIAFIQPNWLITKYNLNIFTDKMTNKNYTNWIRLTPDKKIFFAIVETGPLGLTKGLMAGDPADVLNKGDYTVSLQNGNKAIVVNDLLSQDANMTEEMGWKLMHRKFGIFGYDAYRKAVRNKMVEENLIYDDEIKLRKEEY